MKNILIITSSFDLTVDYIISKYMGQANFYRLNLDLFTEYLIDIMNFKGWSIYNKNWTISENTVDSIYYRKPTLPSLKDYEPRYRSLMYKDIISTIDGIVEVFKGRCLSKPSILRKSENKIFQLRIAEKVGFEIPESLITNSSVAATAFCSNDNTVVKPLSIGKLDLGNDFGIIQTNMVDKSKSINNLEASPAYFQQYINKDFEVRATIIDGNCHAVRIDSKDKIDWRKNNNKINYTKITLPDEIQNKCFKMLEKLQLSFGAFDFIVDKGEFIFLEVNPNGQWYWLEEALNLKISNDILEFLQGED